MIYKTKQGHVEPPTGDFLGDLTNELDDDDYIVEFVSGGPKVYAYRTKKNKTTVKIRGITLNSTTSEKLNFDTLKSIICQFLDTGDRGRIDVLLHRIERKNNRDVLSRKMLKQYRVTYDKRKVNSDGSTVPFGF